MSRILHASGVQCRDEDVVAELAAALREVGRIERSLFMIESGPGTPTCAGAPWST